MAPPTRRNHPALKLSQGRAQIKSLPDYWVQTGAIQPLYSIEGESQPQLLSNLQGGNNNKQLYLKTINKSAIFGGGNTRDIIFKIKKRAALKLNLKRETCQIKWIHTGTFDFGKQTSPYWRHSSCYNDMERVRKKHMMDQPKNKATCCNISTASQRAFPFETLRALMWWPRVFSSQISSTQIEAAVLKDCRLCSHSATSDDQLGRAWFPPRERRPLQRAASSLRRQLSLW